MPNTDKRSGQFTLKQGIQLVAGIIFIGLGVFILFSHFENNYVLVWPKKQLFGGILCLYGLVRIVRIYFALRTQKHYHYENTD